MKANINYTAIDELSVADIAELPLDTLAEFQSAIDADAETVKQRKAKLKAAFDQRYGEIAQQQRLAAGKDSGTTRLKDEASGLTVKSVARRKVSWDQSKLAEIAQRIIANGENPAIYMTVTYSVSEAQYKAFAPAIKAAFDVARTVDVSTAYEIEK